MTNMAMIRTSEFTAEKFNVYRPILTQEVLYKKNYTKILLKDMKNHTLYNNITNRYGEL